MGVNSRTPDPWSRAPDSGGSGVSGRQVGNLRDLYNAVAGSGTKIYLSGASSKARGLDASFLSGKPVEMATPNVLVKLSLEHDRMFTY